MTAAVQAEIDTINRQFMDGDEAHELGAFTIYGADGVLDQGKYIVLWKKTAAGWRWHWDMWNSNTQ